MIKDARKYNLPQKQSCTPHREMILHKMTNLRVILLLLEGEYNKQFILRQYYSNIENYNKIRFSYRVYVHVDT